MLVHLCSAPFYVVSSPLVAFLICLAKGKEWGKALMLTALQGTVAYFAFTKRRIIQALTPTPGFIQQDFSENIKG